MNNLNSILIEGNLVKDPMIRSTPKGTQVCMLRMASSRYYKRDNQSSGFEKEVHYFDIESWARLAELCYAKGKKGRGVRVVGRLKQSRWNDPEGKPRSKVIIVADHVEFRTEFKKDENPAMNISFDEDYNDEPNDEASYAMAEKELERVVF